jgi:hypothetical protein
LGIVGVIVVVVVVVSVARWGWRKSQGSDEILNPKTALRTNFGEKLRVRVLDDHQTQQLRARWH